MGVGACFGQSQPSKLEAGDEDAYTTGGLDFQPDAVKAESLNEPAPVTPGPKHKSPESASPIPLLGNGVSNCQVGLQLAGLDMGDPFQGSRVAASAGGHPGGDAVEKMGEQHFQPMAGDGSANVIQIARMDDFDDDGTVRVTNHVQVAVESDGIKRFNQYVAVALLGKGSFGKVKLVVPDGTETYKAMKTLRRYRSLADIQNDLNTVRTLKHDNLVRIYEAMHDSKKKKLHLVMEFFEAGPIAEVQRDGMVRCRKAYDVVRLRRHICQIGSGLTYLHKQQIIHRDIKPPNVLLDARDGVKLTDFGFRHALLDSPEPPGQLEGGLPAFISPEVLAGSDDSGYAVDMWAFGVMIYCLVYRRLPFFGETPSDVHDAIRTKIPTFEGHDPEVADLMEKMLQKDWRKRLGESAFWHHPFVCMPGTAQYDPLAISVGDLDNRGNS
eukprot:EG_transcript_7851